MNFSAEIVRCGRARERKRCHSSVGVSMCGHRVRDQAKNSQTLRQQTVTKVNLASKLIYKYETHFYQYTGEISGLETYEELRSNVSPNQQGLTGCLRISAPVSFGRLHLPKILHSFSLHHPELELDVQLSDHRTNLIEEGIDIALRIGRLEDSRLRFRRLTPISMCLVASPDYLERAGYPEHPDDLSQHRLLKYNAVRDLQVILYGTNDEKFTVRMEGLFSSNNGDLITSMALLGCGITVGPRFICWQELAEGKLVKLLPEYRFPEAALHALYPTGRFTPMKVRLFIDHLVDEFRECAYWERD